MAITTSQITITTMEGWYSGDTAPSNPLIGDLWLDTTTNEIKKWDGTNWVKQADTQGPQGPKGDSIKSRDAYWIKSSSSIAPEPPDPKTGDMKGWTKGSEPPESALAGILPSDKFWRIYKETYSNGESEYIKYSEVELIGSYEVLNGLVQFRKGITTTENIDGQDVTVIDGGKIKTGSIEADKMSIKDLSALKAKIGGFNVGENSIYSGTKSSINNTEKGIYFDSNGHSYFGDDKNFIRFYQSAEDGKYKLQVSADSLTFGSSESVEKAIDNLEIGGRNLFANSLQTSHYLYSDANYISINLSGWGVSQALVTNVDWNAHVINEIVLSMYLKPTTIDGGGSICAGFQIFYTDGTFTQYLGGIDWASNNTGYVVGEEGYCKLKCAIPEGKTIDYIVVAIRNSISTQTATVEYREIKLEAGNKATSWTPAPEDVDAGIANAQTTADTAKTNAATAQSTADTAKANAAAAQTAADKAQTAADEALKGTKENAAQMAQMVTDFNGDIKNLQDQIDGNITTWFYNVDPAINLPPVTDWDTDKKKDAHLGDIYYNTVKGYAWRFMKSGSTYSWERITDTDVTKALADAANAQDTADSKRRVFYSTPTVPYDAGDLWVQGSGGDILRCAQAKKSTGSYDRNDWVLASKYTDDSALTTWITGDFATTIQGLEEGLVDAKIETYYQATDPSTGWLDTQKLEHEGDLWYNSTASVQKYYRWSGTAWQELTATPPKEVFDSIDNKATIYTGTTHPSSPSQGDLWLKGANNPILTYVGNTWVEYNKYTDNTRAEEAYDKAGEAAKTADNYISADSTGIMVSENKGATKETPSNATKNNVLITDQDVQIRNGKKVVASYGDSIRLGEAVSQHISVDNSGLAIQDGDKKQFEVRTLTSDLTFTDVWLDAGRISPDSGIDTSKVFYAAEIDSVLDSTYYYEEILNLTFPSQGVPKVTLIFGGGNSGYNVPADPSSAIYFTADQSIAGEALKLVIDYRNNPSGVSGGFNWSDLSAIKVEYTINFTPTTVRIGDGATKDTFINDGTSVNSFKALKVGKGMSREGNWQNDNAFDVDFNGNTYVGGDLTVNKDIVNLGARLYTGEITVLNDVYCNGNVYSERPDGAMLSITDLIYPVGSVYISVNSTDPGMLFGGTWERIKDRFLLSAGDTYSAGNTGGSAKATLPSHTHTLGSGGYQLWAAKIGTGSTEPGNQISGDAKYYAAAKGKSTSNYKWLENVDSKGASDVSQANMPPYLAVYVWKRIS